MTEPRHTPGPWVIDLQSPFVLGGDCRSVIAMTPDLKYERREIANLMFDTDSHPDGPEWLEDAANARLIAAAPDLLAACKAALVDCELDHKNAVEQEWRSSAAAYERLGAVLRAAIAKAEG